MEKLSIIVSVVSILGTLSSIYYACSAYKRTKGIDDTKEVKETTILTSDIKYIKMTIDRMDNKLEIIERKYEEMKERLIKVETMKVICHDRT